MLQSVPFHFDSDKIKTKAGGVLRYHYTDNAIWIVNQSMCALLVLGRRADICGHPSTQLVHIRLVLCGIELFHRGRFIKVKRRPVLCNI